MQITINEQTIVLGGRVAPADLARAGFRRAGLLRRLLRRERSGLLRLTAENCTVDCFAGAFSLYACTERYITTDRQWQTRADVFLAYGRVVRVEVQVMEGRYAAGEFYSRFAEACGVAVGESTGTGHRELAWHDGEVRITSALLPGGRNASFVFQAS